MFAEYVSTYRSAISLLLITVFSIGNLICQADKVSRTTGKAVTVLDFFSGTFHSMGQGVSRMLDSYGNYNDLKKERDALKDKLDQIRSVEFQMDLLRNENVELRRNLSLPEVQNHSAVSAEVISMDPDNWFRTIIINKGSTSGIETYMPVIAYQVVQIDDGVNPPVEKLVQGVVGKIIQVNPNSSRILPITDQYSRLGVQVKRTGHWGIVTGQGQLHKLPRVEYMSLALEAKEGEEFITSGGEGVFPQGLLVGRATKEIRRGATFQEIVIEPSLDFHRLKTVLVLKKSFKSPRADFFSVPSRELEAITESKVTGNDSGASQKQSPAIIAPEIKKQENTTDGN